MKKDRLTEYIAAVLLAASIVSLVFVFANANISHYTARMESDIASETLLATVLYENNFIQPDSWYASTAIRLISTPNLAAFIYPLVGMDANLAMGISCTVMMVIMLVVMGLYCKQTGFPVLAALSSILLVLAFTKPSDEWQRMIFVYASYYVSHVITLFMILMLYNRAVRKQKVELWVFALSMLVAVVNGLQGMHGCLFTYLPLLGLELVKRAILRIQNKKLDRGIIFAWTMLMTAASVIASKLTASNNIGASRNIRNAFPKFRDEVWPSVMEMFGFDNYGPLRIVIIFAAVVGYILALKKLFGRDKAEPESYSVLLFPAGFVVCLMLTTFTTVEVAGRYFLMLLFTVAVGDALFIMNVKSDSVKAFTFFIAIFGLLQAAMFNDALVIHDDAANVDNYKVAAWMNEKNYEYGYSSFDHANYITVMGNNTAKVRAVNNMKDMKGCKWLTDTNWYPPIKSADGPTCYIVTEHLNQEFSEFMDREEPKVIETAEIGKFTIYVLDHDYTMWE